MQHDNDLYCIGVPVVCRRVGVGAGLDREMMIVFENIHHFYLAAAAFLCLASNEVQAQPRAPAIVAVCAPCHGIDGAGGDVEKPNLAGQHSIYLRQQLLNFRSGKRKHPDMSKRARDLTDREIDQLVIYYSTLISR